MIRAVAAVIQKNRRYLACKRPGGKHHGGLWDFPGGKVRAEESDFDAVRRELAEELDMRFVSVPGMKAFCVGRSDEYDHCHHEFKDRIPQNAARRCDQGFGIHLGRI